jgi:hypothetical protein
MAKKGKGRKRTTKRSTKAGKRRRPSAKGKGGEVSPPPAALEITTTPPDVEMRGTSGWKADTFVLPKPVPITPTVYPDSPHGTVIVNDHVTINIRTEEFIRFNTEIELLIRELRYSNEISAEVRDQLLSELKAGREIITGPKPQRDLVDLLLVKPLKWLAKKSGSAIVSKLAADALTWLLKILKMIS